MVRAQHCSATILGTAGLSAYVWGFMKLRLTGALAAALILAACAPLNIGRINSDPSRFRNQTVRVSGTVTNSVGLLGKGGYEIEDPTGKIYVISGSGVPSRGSKVLVTGRVVPGAEVLGTAVGVTIREQSHKVK
jgi:hypothetical protein